jgi:hypothetical protein
MKKIFYFMAMVAALVGMTLMFSTKSMAAMAPTDEFAGITIEKGHAKDVAYETGGVGIEERATMQKSMKDYNVRLVFANTKGWYLSSVPVQINGTDGKVLLKEESNGPWFWVKLPQGSYEIVASYGNKQEVHKIDVGKTPQNVEFMWNLAK